MIELKYPIVELANTLNKSPQSIHKLCNEVKIPINSEKGRSFLPPESIRQYLERLKYHYPKRG